MKSKIASNRVFSLCLIGAILISLIPIYDAYAELTITDRKKIDTSNSTTFDGISLDIAADDFFGYQIENIEDLDGDGVDDLATIMYEADLSASNVDLGSILILFMNNNGTVKSTNEIVMDTTVDGIGASCIAGDDSNRGDKSLEQLAFVGDLDGDGMPTLALGASSNDHGAADTGAIYMLELKTSGKVDNCLRIIPGENGFNPADNVYNEIGDPINSNAALGWPLIATDVNGDGQMELIAGADSNNDDYANLWPLFLNSTGGVESHPATPIKGETDIGIDTGNYMDDGISVDGGTKIAISVQKDATGEGSVFIVTLNSTGGFSSSSEITGISLSQGINADPLADNFGSGLAPLGDMDNDGVNDILVGNELGDDTNANSGEAYILYMNSDDTVKESQKISNDSEFARTGVAPLSGGDLFGHGMTVWLESTSTIVIAISATQDDTGGGNSGAIHLFYIEKPIVEVKKNGGGCDDCTPPTLGINSHGERLVDGGFSYNGKTVDAALFHTKFPLINATIGEINLVKVKIYENQGVQNIQDIQFGLGVKEVGLPLNLSEVIIQVILHNNGTAVKEIDFIDNENLIENNSITATVDTIKCKTDSNKEDCLLVNLQYSYREAPKYNVMMVTPMDDKRNTWNFYFNDGIRVIGESLNPPPTHNIHVKKSSQALDNWLTLIRTDKINDVWTDKKGIQYQNNNNNFDRITPHESWTCKDKPLDQINVPTRNNCNFRALTLIWDY